MHAFSRRHLMASLVFSLASGLLVGCSDDHSEHTDPKTNQEVVSTTSDRPDSGAKVTVFDHGKTRVHAYTAPESFAGNGLYVIEGDAALVVVDVGFGSPIAADLRAYVDSLGKSIDRVIITHEHPDHWLNLGDAFPNAPAYSPPDTVSYLAANGQGMFDGFGSTLGPVAPTTFKAPDQALTEGDTTIDGVRYAFEFFEDAEAEQQVVIRLPDLDTIITGDLSYNGYHLVLNPNLSAWSTIATTLEKGSPAIVLPGHGAPTDTTVYGANVQYLTTASSLFEANPDDPDGFAAGLRAAYPNLLGADLFIGLSQGRLYPEPQ